MSDFKVLLVEDDEDLRTGIMFLLKKLLPEVEYFGAENGLKAIKMIIGTKNKFDLIISDIRMPKISGIELARYLNRKNIFVNLIALTGEEISEDILLKVGFAKVLRKSDNFHNILENLYSNILSHRESERILSTQSKLVP